MQPIVSADAQVNVHIRWLIRVDMPAVLWIEQHSFAHPWEEEDFLRCLRQRDCIGMVAEHGEKVLGFMIYELSKPKLDIINFAVHPAWRRRGVGRQMAHKLTSKLTSHRRTRVELLMRETSLDAQFFFHACGFRACQVLRGYYEDTGEDAYRFVYRLAFIKESEGSDE